MRVGQSRENGFSFEIDRASRRAGVFLRFVVRADKNNALALDRDRLGISGRPR